MTTSQETTSSSFKPEKRIDLLFSKFAASYGNLWRSQFKDEGFLRFAKKEWQLALSEFSDGVLSRAILNCRSFYELPPTLPQVMQCCREIRKQLLVVVKEPHVPANKAVVQACLQSCKQRLGI